MKYIKPDYFRNFVFGAEDSLVSTLGVMFGVASASAYTKSSILLTGLIVIAVEALSMGAGSFLSESSTQEVSDEEKHDNPVVSGIIMFLSYFITGFIPISPYLIFSVEVGKYVSVAVTFVALYVLGYAPTKSIKSGFRMVLVAGAAVLIGFLIAEVFSPATAA